MPFFSSSTRQTTPEQIYASSMGKAFAFGHALWCPEPQDSGEVQIGDVGFLEGGALHRLFNLDPTMPATGWDPAFDHQTAERLPQGAMRTYNSPRLLINKPYRTRGVRTRETRVAVQGPAGPGLSAGLEAKYECKEASGAILVLKTEADGVSMYQSHPFKHYIVRNHPHWLAYARDDLGLDVKDRDLVVVYATVKTQADWAVGAFRSTHRSAGASLRADARGVVDVDLTHEGADTVTSAEMERYGVYYKADPSHPRRAQRKKDQCVFLKRYKVLRWFGIVPNLFGGAGYHQLPRGENSTKSLLHEDSYVKRVPWADFMDMTDKTPDYLDTLLLYIFEIVGTQVAIASDGDVESILNGTEVEDFGTYLRQTQPTVIAQDGVGYISMQEVITRQYEHIFTRRFVKEHTLIDWPNAALHCAGNLEYVLADRSLQPEPIRPLRFPAVVFRDLENLHDGCHCFTLSKDDCLMTASFSDDQILVWRLSDGLLVQRLVDHGGHILSLAMSSDHRTLVSGSEGSSPLVWDVRTGAILHRLVGHSGGDIHCAAYSLDDSLIATASHEENAIRVWSPQSASCLHYFPATDAIRSVTFSPDNRQLYVQLYDILAIYDLATKAPGGALRTIVPDVLQWALSSDGEVLATLSAEKHLQARDAKTGNKCRNISLPATLDGPIAYSPSGAELLACCTSDKTAIVFDTQTGVKRCVYQASEEVRCIAYSPQGTFVALGLEGSLVEIFDVGSSLRVARFTGLGEVEDVQFLARRASIVVRQTDGPVRLLSVQDALRLS